MDEIRDFFGTRFWKLDIEGGKLSAVHEEFDIIVTVSREETEFKVVAEAKDDPSDKLEVVTDNPMKELTDFLSAGLPGGGEAFKEYASNPTLLSKVIRRVARKIRQLGPKKTAAFVKQAVLILGFDSLQKLVKVAVEGAYGEAEAFDLFQKMKKKGWDVEEVEIPGGRAGIKANFHDLYDIEIMPEAINYEYEYMIEGYPESIYWGTTDDPIRAFEDWVKTENFEKASEERNEELDETPGGKKTVVDAKSVMETVKPGADKPTVAPKSKTTPEAYAPTLPSEREPPEKS